MHGCFLFCPHLSCGQLKWLIASHGPADAVAAIHCRDETSRARGAGVHCICLEAEMRPQLPFMYVLAPTSDVISSGSSELALNHSKRADDFKRQPYGNTCPGQREGDRRERCRPHKLSRVCHLFKKPGGLFFLFSISLGFFVVVGLLVWGFFCLVGVFLFVCFEVMCVYVCVVFCFVSLIGSEQLQLQLVSPHCDFPSSSNQCPRLGLCRSIALACLLQREAARVRNGCSNIPEAAIQAHYQPPALLRAARRHWGRGHGL